MKAAQLLAAGVGEIEGIEVVGRPEMTVVAFKASKPRGRGWRRGGGGGAAAAAAAVVDIYRVGDLLSQRGWHLNALQRPAALHICLTAAHSPAIVELLLRDLREAVATVQMVRSDDSERASCWSCRSVLERLPAEKLLESSARALECLGVCAGRPASDHQAGWRCSGLCGAAGSQGGRRWQGTFVRHGCHGG